MQGSKIEWTDDTFNPWIGCAKVSEACRNCYAEDATPTRTARARGLELWGPEKVRQMTQTWRDLGRMDAAAKAAGVKRRVFMASLSDVFEDFHGPVVNHKGTVLYLPRDHPTIPPELLLSFIVPAGDATGFEDLYRPVTLGDLRRQAILAFMGRPNLIPLFLTKRPENVERMTREAAAGLGCAKTAERMLAYMKAVPWIGTTVEDQRNAGRLLHLASQPFGAVLWASCEPLLGPLDLTDVKLPDGCSYNALSGRRTRKVSADVGHNTRLTAESEDMDPASRLRPLGWVVAGGESGDGARPSHPDWFRVVRDQCAFDRVPFHFKQWGDYEPLRTLERYAGPGVHDFDDGVQMHKVGKKAAGRLLDGRTHDGLPDLPGVTLTKAVTP